MEAGRDQGGWKRVAALGTAQIASWGVLYYAFGVLLPSLETDLGLSIAELTGAFSLALAVSAIAGVGVGRWLDHHSPRPVMAGGSVLAVALVCLWSQIDTAVELYLVFAGIGLAMAAVLYEPAMIVITKTFRRRRREALTALTLIAALASFGFSPLAAHLAEALGWRDALLVLAAILAVVTIPLHLVALGPLPKDSRGEQDSRTAGLGGGGPGGRAGFGLLTVAFVLATLATSAIAVLLVATLIDRGHDTAFAAFVAGLVGIAQIPGRILFALAARWLSSYQLTGLAFLLIAGALGLLALGQGRSPAVAFALAFGAGAGMLSLLRADLVGTLYGRARYGRNSGLMAAFATSARAAAPLMGGITGAALGFSALLWILAAGSGAGGLAALAGLRQAEAAQRPCPIAG